MSFFTYSVYSVPLAGGSEAVFNTGNFNKQRFFGIAILHGTGITEWSVIQSHTIALL